LAEWLVEEGIGEDRAIQLDHGIITHAILDWHDDLRSGQVEEAKLLQRTAGSSRGFARFANMQHALVDRLPADASEGAAIRLEVTRAAINEERRSKPAQARPTDKPLNAGQTLADTLNNAGKSVRIVRKFPDCDWDELLSDAIDRRVSYEGGELHFSLTPAMTLIDVDTNLDPANGALTAVPAIATSLKRFCLGGSIGIDFPTVQTKGQRRAVDDALSASLADWPHERTAMNGFGFVQIVARLERQSLLHMVNFRQSRSQIYQLFRQAEHLEGSGAIELRGDSALFEVWLEPEERLLQELRRRTGKDIRIVYDDNLASRGPHAQLVSR